MAKKAQEEKDENGKCKNSVKGGKKGGKVTSAQLWKSTMDGFISNAGCVSQHNKARGWDPDARVRIQ